MKRVNLLLASLLVSMLSFAQWTKPAPAFSELVADGETEYFLYNVETCAFFLGTNDWKTRASLSREKGYKVRVQTNEEGNYTLQNFVEINNWGDVNQWMSVGVRGVDDIYVDRDEVGTWTITKLDGNKYTLGATLREGYFGTDKNFAYDTRLYMVTGGAITWAFVAPADYEAYMANIEQNLAKIEQCEAAERLAAIIERVENDNPGINLSAIKAVYNNQASTTAQLLQACTDCAEAEIAFQTASVSVDTPANYTARIQNATYEGDSKAGWEGADPGVSFGVAEFYGWDGKDIINYHQTISNLPAGVYRVGVTGFYRSGSNAADCENYQDKSQDYCYAKVYADGIVACTAPIPLQSSGAQDENKGFAGAIETTALGCVPNNMEAANYYFEHGFYEPATVLGIVGEDGKLTIGLQKNNGKPDNWLIFDNWTLEYLGASAEAYELVREKVMKDATDYYTEGNGSGFYCEQSVYDAYADAYEALDDANSPEAIAAALPAFCTNYAAAETSVIAYSAYIELLEKAEAWYDENHAEGESVDMQLLGQYLNGDVQPAEGELNGNGSSNYIKENCQLNSEQVIKETEYLNEIYLTAKLHNMKDGDDCTDQLVNANFSTEGGWISDTPNASWPHEGKNVGQFTHLFNVHQELEEMAEGLYEFETYDIFYPEGTNNYIPNTVDKFKGYIYLNGYSCKMNDCGINPSPEKLNDWDFEVEGGFAPTNSTAAAAFFDKGFYKHSVYGIVGKDGKLKVGYRIDRRDEGCVGWWGPARLIYRAKNLEGLKSALEMLANEIIENNLADSETGEVDESLAAGQNYIHALSSAMSSMDVVFELPEETDEEKNEKSNKLYDAVIELKQTIDDLRASLTIYSNLYTAITGLEDAIQNVKNPDALTLAKAKETADNMNAAYQAGSLNNAEAEAAIEELSTLRVALMLGKGIASEENPIDMSDAIVNNHFDPARGVKGGAIEGWTLGEGSSTNGYKEWTCSFNRGIIDLSQKLTGLPKGKYKVTVHTYYRAGYWDEEWNRKEAGEETHLTTLYAQTSEDKYAKPVLNLYEGALDEKIEGLNFYDLPNGKFAPDGTSPTAACFAAGHYLNELRFNVGENGEATIGLSKTEILPNDYQVVGEWKLWYMGEDADVQKADTIDISSVIVNNHFDPARGVKGGAIEGWTLGEGSSTNGYKEWTCSFNRGIIDLSQELSGLDKGKYLLTVHTYYRAGYWDEEWARKEAGEETHLTTMYAQTSVDKYAKPVMNLYEGALDEKIEGLNFYDLPNGKFAPDGTSPTAACFAAGHYLNKLEFTVGEDGKATIGLSKTEILPNDYQVVGEWNLYQIIGGNAGEQELKGTDMSDLIVNNHFDPARGVKGGAIEGWTLGEGCSTNGYKEWTCSFNRGVIDLSQELSGLPEGTYNVTVHSYYRAGYWDEEWNRKEAGEETHLTTMYAQTSSEKYSKPVMNLYEGALDEKIEGLNFYDLPNGKFAPDGTSPTAASFAAGYYLNELPFYVSDGKVRIGLRKTEILPNDYQVVGEWKLYYYGSGNNVDTLTGIENIEISEAAPVVLVPVAYYNLNGVRLAAPQRGLNIVKMSDGSAIKIMVK